jgi:hypothetical protein
MASAVRAEVRQAALLGFLVPILGVVVAIEHDAAMLGDDFLQHALDGLCSLSAVGFLPPSSRSASPSSPAIRR